MVSDPDGIRRVLQDNSDNYLRVSPVRRAFEFSARAGMVCIEGEEWWHHRRVLNPALDHRALRPDVPRLIELTEEMARHLAELPPGEAVEIGRTLTHLLTRTTGQVFAGDDPLIDAMLLRMGRYPEQYSLFDLLPLPAVAALCRPLSQEPRRHRQILCAARPAGCRAARRGLRGRPGSAVAHGARRRPPDRRAR